MTDSWERRNVPYTDGYNNPASQPFNVTYDAAQDLLTMTSVEGLFEFLDSIDYSGELNGTEQSGVGTLDNFTATIENASVQLGIGEITQVDFYEAGPTLIGTWTGSVEITGTPEILTYDSGTDTLTITDVGGNFTPDVDFVAFWTYDYPVEAWAPNVVYVSPTQIQVTPAVDIGFQTDGTPVSHFIHHVAVAENADDDYPNTVVFEADVAFNEFTNPDYPLVSSATSDGPGRLLIDGARFLTGGTEVLNQVQVISDSGPNINYYDPNGPDAALNPVGSTINLWTNTGISIEDPGLSGYELGVLGNIHGADLRGRFRLWGGTSGAPVEVGRFVPHPHFTIA